MDLPSVQVFGQQIAPRLSYSSKRANPGTVIDVKLRIDPESGVELGNFIGYELYIQGQKTDSFTFGSNLATGEVGRYRYFWDGRDAQGNQLPPGIYEYRAKLSVPYTAQYCGSWVFGGPPDCVRRPTGRFVQATVDTWVRGTVKLNAQADSPLGAGWAVEEMQRLYEDEAGRIMVSDGKRTSEFYFPWKDQLAGQAAVTRRTDVEERRRILLLPAEDARASERDDPAAVVEPAAPAGKACQEAPCPDRSV